MSIASWVSNLSRQTKHKLTLMCMFYPSETYRLLKIYIEKVDSRRSSEIWVYLMLHSVRVHCLTLSDWCTAFLSSLELQDAIILSRPCY